MPCFFSLHLPCSLWPAAMSPPAIACEAAMTEVLAGLALAAALGLYLLYTLIHPEKF